MFKAIAEMFQTAILWAADRYCHRELKRRERIAYRDGFRDSQMEVHDRLRRADKDNYVKTTNCQRSWLVYGVE